MLPLQIEPRITSNDWILAEKFTVEVQSQGSHNALYDYMSDFPKTSPMYEGLTSRVRLLGHHRWSFQGRLHENRWDIR